MKQTLYLQYNSNNQVNKAEFREFEGFDKAILIEEILTQEELVDFSDGTDFQKQVWSELINIPSGETRTYKQIAESLGKPKAYRAVANACGANHIAYFIPCHRVVGSDGKLRGYKWGIDLKKKLLGLENNS